jgi:hypothetical protein
MGIRSTALFRKKVKKEITTREKISIIKRNGGCPSPPEK